MLRVSNPRFGGFWFVGISLEDSCCTEKGTASFFRPNIALGTKEV